MNSSLSPSANLRRALGLGSIDPKSLLPLCAFTAFLLIALAAFNSTNQAGKLGISPTPCPAGWCVGRAFPAGQAWNDGARPGDVITHVQGFEASAISATTDWPNVTSVTVVSASSGETIIIEPRLAPIGLSPLRWSLWTVAAAFATLGSIVWFRRPDLPSAVAFGQLGAVASIALAVAPAAGSTKPEWALVIQWLSLAILGPVFFNFVCRLVREQGYRSPILPLATKVLFAISVALVVLYVLSLAVWPLYDLARSSLALTLGIWLISSVAVMLLAILRTERAFNALLIPLMGMWLGVFPFAIAVLIPNAFGLPEAIAPHLAVLPVALIPATFAYTILRNHFWGIRRLIHRGLVYLLLSIIVFGIVALPVLLIDRVIAPLEGGSEIAVMALALLLGVLLFNPVRTVVRKAVDSFIYGGPVSYPEFIQRLHRDITSADPETDLPHTLSQAFVDRLGLESSILLRETDADRLDVIAVAGDQAERVLNAMRNGEFAPPLNSQGGPALVPYEGEQILCVQLWASETLIGTLLLGPKRGGELFVQDEINLIANTAPFMATALDRHELSKTMRQLNQRLVETEERSRQNVAIDLHDGPLQKAVTLAIGRIADPAQQKEVATELVNELREIGSRLRPSILDDFGLPTSLEWLLEHNMRGTEIRGSLTLQGMEDDTRLSPEVELTLFRIAQESINNAVKHSEASELRITLSQEDEQLTMTIRDNGLGMGGGSISRIASSRLGLVGMRERAMQVGGHLEIQSRPGEGVFIQATVPLADDGEFGASSEGTSG